MAARWAIPRDSTSSAKEATNSETTTAKTAATVTTARVEANSTRTAVEIVETIRTGTVTASINNKTQLRLELLSRSPPVA